MMGLLDPRGEDPVDLGALRGRDDLENEVEAPGTEDGTVQALRIVGGHEEQDMGTVVELLKEREEHRRPQALPELDVRAGIELLLQPAARTELTGLLLVQHLGHGALLLMERMPASEQLLHLVEENDAVP